MGNKSQAVHEVYAPKKEGNAMSEPIVPPTEPVQVKDDVSYNIPTPQASPALSVSLLEIFLAICLGLCFFLPWMNILGVGVSGFQIQKLGHDGLALWLIPITSVIAILAGCIQKSQKDAAMLAGITPFGIIIYFCIQAGNDYQAIINLLGGGAWAALVIGFLMIILSFSLKNSEAKP
jgi:hypothetical protein